jgi:acyl transferase domain-containing protein/acyl carrier protein
MGLGSTSRENSPDKTHDDGPRSSEIAIIGMSGRFPGGANSPELLWQTLSSGVDAVGEARGDRWDLGWHNPDPERELRVYTRAGGFLDRVDGFDAEFFGMSPREARQVDPQHRLLLELAWEAHENASIAPRSRAGSDTGVFVGISSNEYAQLVGPIAPDAYANTGSSMSIAANRISYLFDFHGPSVAIDTACSSSIVCVHQACRSLLAGECSTALAGGVSLMLSILPWLGFAKASMLSPTGRCRSFDAGGDGYVRSEGGGFVLLKRLAEAERDGDRILGVIVASGVNSDGRTMGLSMPNGEAQERLLRKVYGQCGIEPEDVFYVEAHGTGTSVGDPIECGALGRVLGAPRTDGSQCLVGSVKSNIGHLEAASGIAGLTKVLLSLQHGEIPGNLHFKEPNPKIDFAGWKLGVVTEATPLPQGKRPVVIGVNSFGFGGTNAHLVLRQYRPKSAIPAPKANPPSDCPQVLVLTAQSDAGLRAVAEQYVYLLRDDASGDWSAICAAAATCRSLLRHRLALSAASKEEAAVRLESFLNGHRVARLATGNVHSTPTPIAFVYSGNGPQWWGMGRELLAGEPVFRKQIDAIDAIFAPLSGWSLIEEMGLPEAASRIERTEIAQPMLFALQLGLTSLLRASGIHPSAVLGHSVGEAAAAWASGALSLEQATRVIFHRSQAQAGTAGKGRMAALGVSAAAACEAMQAIPGWLELAATNAPEAVTVAGDPAALEALVQALTAQGKFARMLQLNYPFHTRAMEPIRAELLDGLRDLAPAATEVSFVSTVDAAEIAGESLDVEYWFRNVREPVRFGEAVTHLVRERGFALFIEIGPHPVLKDYIVQSAKACDASITALQTLRRPAARKPEPELDHLWTAICACHANGASELDTLFTRPVPAPALPTYPWQRVTHWRGDCLLPDTHHAVHRDHPLLGYRLPSSDGLWENALDINQLRYLRDHVVQGAILFPAAGYVELGLAAARRTLGDGVLEIEDFEILRPLAIPAHADPILQVAIDARDGTFEVRSRPDKLSEEWTRQVRGRVSRSDGADHRDTFDPASLAAKLPEEVSGEEHYADSARRGLLYGKAFQGIERLRLSASRSRVREAVAEIFLPELDQPALAGYLAHPALLDSCVQTFLPLVAHAEGRTVTTLPVRIDRVRSFAPLPNRILCTAKLTHESARSVAGDLRVTDPSGRLLLSIAGLRCQKVDFNQAPASQLIESWWRLDPLAEMLAPLSSLPAPAVIAASIKREINALADRCRRKAFYEEVRPRIDRLVGSYAAQAIAALLSPAALQPNVAAFDLGGIARSGGVSRDRMPMLGWAARIAEQDGFIHRTDGPDAARWRWSETHTAGDAEDLWSALLRDYPGYQAELMLLAEAGSGLATTLRGEGPTPDATASLREQIAEAAPYQAFYNQAARAALRELVKAWPRDRPLRILQVGGGVGLASWLLPDLPGVRTDYLFTADTEAAVERAKHRLGEHRFLRFAVLDTSSNAEQDLIAQGCPAGYFDLVIAELGAAHGAEHGRESVDFNPLLPATAPDAQVLLVAANPDRFTELVYGLHVQPTSLDGLDGIEYLSDLSACPEGKTTQQSVVLARLPRESAQHGMIFSSPVVSSADDAESLRRFMLVVENSGVDDFSQLLTNTLAQRGHEVTIHHFPHFAGEAADESLRAAILDAWQQSLADEVVFIAAASNPHTPHQEMLETQRNRCLTVIGLVRALESTRAESATQLKIVTRGAFADGLGNGPLDPAQAPLWGLGRVLSNEHPGLACRLIDLHSDATQSATWLAAELLRGDDETEVQLVSGFRFVNRERLMTMTDEARESAARNMQKAGGEALPFALDFLPQGGLDSLYLRELDRRAPGANEVEIAVRAAGLNFRDVLWSMGVLPEEAVENGFSGAAIGMECSGEITRTGSAVTGLKPGDRVVAFASSCFASHVTTSAGSVAHIPERIDFAEAATIPTAFLTAWYALDHLARLSPGESILIHGAAGGVGLAAIQIAKLKGAKVFGTAGSARKRRMLETIGVDHVLNSRSLDFADKVMELTGGIGVDAVLNSLAGEAITKSLACLRPFGRFLEIGKRDLYANSRVGLRPFRNNLSYFGIDADTLLSVRPDLARSVFDAVMQQFATGALTPLPFQTIPISRASEAFRAMQQSRHIGKLVVTMDSDSPASLPIVRSKSIVRADATYLVTGGLGGFGLATAKWLAEQGARSLALIGRRGTTTDEATAGIAELKRTGATVRAFAADITDANAVESVVAEIRATMPPLKGVIHSAAVIEDAPVLGLEAEQLDRVLGPKILGAWNLHLATLPNALHPEELEMFVLYSSSSTVVGNPGQGAYVAGNLYLDSLAQYRRAHGLPGLAIGWGAIKDAGFLARNTNIAEMLRTKTGLDATPTVEAFKDLARLTAIDATRVCVAHFDLQRLGQSLPAVLVPRFYPIITRDAAESLRMEETLVDRLLRVPEEEHRALLLACVREHAARTLGTSPDRIDPAQTLGELGLDSLMAVELAVALERDLAQPVSVMQLLSAGTISAVAELARKMLAATLRTETPAAQTRREPVLQEVGS